jgi:hypothetical protein
MRAPARRRMLSRPYTASWRLPGGRDRAGSTKPCQAPAHVHAQQQPQAALRRRPQVARRAARARRGAAQGAPVQVFVDSFRSIHGHRGRHGALARACTRLESLEFHFRPALA